MAKIDSTDPTVFMNPSAYSGIKENKKTKGARKSETSEFSSFFNSLLGKTADDLGPVQTLPVSDESVTLLMDEVRDAGDRLISRPLPEEIIRYKQAVRSFINYIIKNNLSLGHDEGLPNFLKPGFKGQRGTPQAMKSFGYTKIEVLDKKLEDLAAMLLGNQVRQLELVSRIEEIKGLLVDLMQ